jgi:hypothetical protein
MIKNIIYTFEQKHSKKFSENYSKFIFWINYQWLLNDINNKGNWLLHQNILILSDNFLKDISFLITFLKQISIIISCDW